MRQISNRVLEYVSFMRRLALDPGCECEGLDEKILHARDGFTDEEHHDIAMLQALRLLAHPDMQELVERHAGRGRCMQALQEQRRHWQASDAELQALLEMFNETAASSRCNRT